MRSGLTKREKVLLIIGGSVLVLFVAFNYLIIPAYNAYVEAGIRLSDLEFERLETETKIAGRSGVEAVNERVLARYNELNAVFPENMTSYEADRLITGICNAHDLRPLYLDIGVKAAEPGAAVTWMVMRVSVTAGHAEIQELINTVNNTAYMYISAFNYTVRDGVVAADIDFNVQMLS